MEKFFFIPPVDESMPLLKTKQWIVLSVSFFVSLALLTIVMMAFPSHYIFGALTAFTLGATAIPMQMYARNRKGRSIGKLFFVVGCGIALYQYRNLTRTHTFDLLTIMLIVLGVYWLTHCIDQAGNMILERLEALQRRVNSVESKLDSIERTIRKTKPETEEVHFK
jgi:hypothetical protein